MNKLNLFLNRWFSALTVLGISAFAGNSHALTAPYLSNSRIYVDGGVPTGEIVHQDQQQGAGTTTLNYPPSCIPPNCGTVIQAGGKGGEVSVTSNPAAGTISLYTRAVHNTGEKVGWMVTLPGTNPFYYEPQTWGLVSADGYIRSIYQLTSATGGLESGTPATIHAQIDISGIFGSYPTSLAKGAVLINRLEDAYWAQSDQIPTLHFLEDMGIPAWRFTENSTNGTAVDLSDGFDKTFKVGDTIVLEVLFSGASSLQNAGDGLVDTYADFGSTFRTSLSTTTAGASLQLVPIPPALFSFMSGLPLLGMIGLLRRKITA